MTSVNTSKAGMKPKMPSACEFVRSSPDGLVALSNLSRASSVLLFTPVLLPANIESTISDREHIDPFESLGRALSTYHKQVLHVPFVPKTGYTDTHAAFLSQADAIIIMICEPCHDKDRDIARQMHFAIQALESVEGKEANAVNTLILIQSGNEKHRIKASNAFKNVIEVSAYDDEVAQELAKAIFKFRQ